MSDEHRGRLTDRGQPTQTDQGAQPQLTGPLSEIVVVESVQFRRAALPIRAARPSFELFVGVDAPERDLIYVSFETLPIDQAP